MTKEEQLEQCLMGAGISPASASIWASALFLIESQRVSPPPPLKWESVPYYDYGTCHFADVFGGIISFEVSEYPTNMGLDSQRGRSFPKIWSKINQGTRLWDEDKGHGLESVDLAFKACEAKWKEIWEKEMGGEKVEQNSGRNV